MANGNWWKKSESVRSDEKGRKRESGAGRMKILRAESSRGLAETEGEERERVAMR